jgi:hypothetical protein
MKRAETELMLRTVVSSDSTKTADSGEHRSERSEPLDRASLASDVVGHRIARRRAEEE